MASALGAFATLYVLPAVVVPGNANATASDILASEELFRLGIVCELFSAIVLVLCARSLYRLLSAVNQGYASLMVIFVLSALPISFLNALNQIAALLLLSGVNFVSAFGTAQSSALAMLFINLHAQGIGLVEIFWGLWLFPMGLLVYRSHFFPRVLGAFLVIASVGYVAASLFPLLSLPFFNVVSLLAGVAGAFGEGSMIVWLVVKNPKSDPLPPSPDRTVLTVIPD